MLFCGVLPAAQSPQTAEHLSTQRERERKREEERESAERNGETERKLRHRRGFRGARAGDRRHGAEDDGVTQRTRSSARLAACLVAPSLGHWQCFLQRVRDRVRIAVPHLPPVAVDPSVKEYHLSLRRSLAEGERAQQLGTQLLTSVLLAMESTVPLEVLPRYDDQPSQLLASCGTLLIAHCSLRVVYCAHCSSPFGDRLSRGRRFVFATSGSSFAVNLLDVVCSRPNERTIRFFRAQFELIRSHTAFCTKIMNSMHITLCINIINNDDTHNITRARVSKRRTQCDRRFLPSGPALAGATRRSWAAARAECLHFGSASWPRGRRPMAMTGRRRERRRQS